MHIDYSKNMVNNYELTLFKVIYAKKQNTHRNYCSYTFGNIYGTDRCSICPK